MRVVYMILLICTSNVSPTYFLYLNAKLITFVYQPIIMVIGAEYIIPLQLIA